MNFLAHCHLSFGDEELLIGNLSADFLGPNLAFSPHSPRVQEGIDWHYQIDRFTDSHPLVAGCRARFFPFFRHYSAVLVDLYFDHLLALHFDKFSKTPLEEFSQWVYRALEKRHADLPAPLQMRAPHMIAGDWLGSYREKFGVEYALGRVENRAKKAIDLSGSWGIFEEQKAEFERDFLDFFPLLMQQRGQSVV